MTKESGLSINTQCDGLLLISLNVSFFAAGDDQVGITSSLDKTGETLQHKIGALIRFKIPQIHKAGAIILRDQFFDGFMVGI